MAAALRAESVRSSSLSDVGSDISSETRKRKPLIEAAAKPRTRRYHDSSEAPDDFKEQIQILFDEDLRDLAIQSLQSNLFAQSFLSADRPWWVAPPAHIAFLGTLVIHPAHTTKANNDGNNTRIVSVRAYQYLLDVLRSVGPINGHFKAAFAFRDRSSRPGRRRRHSPEESDLNDDDDTLTTKLANADSIWNRVPDFWTMLGWAFACATSYPERWVHWKLWVEFLLEVMERDLEERKALSAELSEKNLETLRSSIIMSYIGEHQLGHILRVLFAYIDGDSHNYKEIWPKETQNTTATNKRKLGDIAELDLERGVYGDWDEDEDEEDEEVEAENNGHVPRSKRRSKKRVAPLVESPLLEETIPIRRRIFALISQVCYDLGQGGKDNGGAPFTIHNLYDQYANRIYGLPLDVFPHFAYVWSDLPAASSMYITLARHLMAWLLPPGCTQPKDVDRETEAKAFVSPIIMERCFLPYATNSVVTDNAKLAVLLWELFSYMWQHDQIALGPYKLNKDGEVQFAPITEEMKAAAEAGIEAREKKCKIKNEAPPSGYSEFEWLDKKMEAIEKDRFAPANVLKLAHLKFRFFLSKETERVAAQRGVSEWGKPGSGKLTLIRKENPRLGGRFLGWN
ncbi:hypothetical protein GE09DRAFT_1102351 [Coniochaeta sp. 2T2.1]|nr:hypothetical protein GE09DRAFT_1102351 [Coniochaeta sp. 2T2.1]